MKHSIIFGLLAVVFATGFVVSPAHAEVATTTAVVTTSATATTSVATSTVTATTTASTTVVTPASSSRIADLLAQLAKLTTIFQELKAKLLGVTTEIHELKGDLKEGMTNDDIKAIQEALASDPSIYPSGLKTGFFGPMTKEAIKRFQAKNGLEVTGEINAETKAALDTIMATRHKEGKFPLGLLLAPGLHRDEFENRLRKDCGVTSASSTVALKCLPLKGKYKFEMEDKHGTTTPPIMRKDQGNPKKEDDKRGRSMHNATSSSSHSDDDSDDDSETDDDEDDN